MSAARLCSACGGASSRRACRPLSAPTVPARASTSASSMARRKPSCSPWPAPHPSLAAPPGSPGGSRRAMHARSGRSGNPGHPVGLAEPRGCSAGPPRLGGSRRHKSSSDSPCVQSASFVVPRHTGYVPARWRDARKAAVAGQQRLCHPPAGRRPPGRDLPSAAPCTRHEVRSSVCGVDCSDRAGLPRAAHRPLCPERLGGTRASAGRPRRKSGGESRRERQYREGRASRRPG
jgi:hypothetical protein